MTLTTLAGCGAGAESDLEQDEANATGTPARHNKAVDANDPSAPINAFVAAYAAYPENVKFPSVDVSKLNAQEKNAESVRLYRFLKGECVGTVTDRLLRPEQQSGVGLYSLDVKVAGKRVPFRMVSTTFRHRFNVIFVFDEAGAFLLLGSEGRFDGEAQTSLRWDRTGSPAQLATFRASNPVCR